MLKPVNDDRDSPEQQTHPRRPRLREIPMLPTLLTLGNLYFGFMAIYLCGREMHDLGAGIGATDVLTLHSVKLEALAPSFLAIAAWMLVAAMICDALDGRVARKRAQMSRFGAQMDTIADVVSFGVAPALMMIIMVRREIIQLGFVPFGFGQFGQAAVFVGIIYVCCAALRLARFTVETTLDESAHHGFRGLPTPAAAAAVISLVYLHDHLGALPGWAGTANVITRALPICTLLIGLLMVSRVRYVHAVSAFLRRRPFGHMIPVLLAFALILLYPAHSAVVLAWGFVISGPVRMLIDKIWAPQEQQTDTDDHNTQHETTRKQA